MGCDKMDLLLLQDYAEGIIEPLGRLFVETHLTACKDCRRELTELKLMLWDLNNKSNYETEYPEELDALGSGLIDDFLGEEEKLDTRRFIDMQLNNMKMSSRFLDYVPGAKQAPIVLKKASKGMARGLAKGVKKILAAR
ncbi:putative zinc finger protein [Ruminiclostridium sufflavum DSM 19573]|uniref:Anti-sigma-W factor RsiW n=1 Tax=Ruminiclostridium sufflavum DSM 19573 TaxID=1121337 RepID=A0A318XQH5_9FIRM|nr:zf-HC2 domain-containing protein [Ruminiclostridium sufflavum]PYG88142.1 putative zinc finger protein [Ruminiclostridium sufflavum DSM 19573]